MKIWQPFWEGFVGSFALAGAIVMAVVGVAAEFMRGDLQQRSPRHTASRM